MGPIHTHTHTHTHTHVRAHAHTVAMETKASLFVPRRLEVGFKSLTDLYSYWGTEGWLHFSGN